MKHICGQACLIDYFDNIGYAVRNNLGGRKIELIYSDFFLQIHLKRRLREAGMITTAEATVKKPVEKSSESISKLTGSINETSGSKKIHAIDIKNFMKPIIFMVLLYHKENGDVKLKQSVCWFMMHRMHFGGVKARFIF